MTSPATLGFPDFQRSYASARNLLRLVFQSAIVANDVSGPLPVGNMHSIGVRAFANVNNIKVLLDWFLDRTFLVFVSSDQFELVQGGSIDQSFPTKAAYLRVTVVPLPAGAATYTLAVYEMPVDTFAQTAPNINQLVGANGTAVGAGATITFDALRAFAGPASLTIFSEDAAAWNGALLTLNAAGTTTAIARASNKFPMQCVPIYLPAMCTRISFTNLDGVGRFVFAFLNAKPLYP
jgi:hypothetical protein